MKALSLCVLCVLGVSLMWAQGVKIGNAGEPDGSAILELESADKGFLPPRMTTSERNAILNPAIGLMVLNTDSNCMEYYRGPVFGWHSLCPQPPILTTQPATPNPNASAQSGGNVVSDGGATVTARGVCWSTSPQPTLADSFTTDGVGIGLFTSTLTGLLPDMTYYIRAYATNAAGTVYGNEVTLSTPSTPVVQTGSTTAIFSTWFDIGGSVTDDGGSPISARGFCYSTNPGPTLAGDFVTAGSGTGNFTAQVGGLTSMTLYHVRAFASNGMFTAYGDEVLVSTNDVNLLIFSDPGSHSWTVPLGITEVEVLVVGGGGAGGGTSGPIGPDQGHYNGGGGGAGGVIHIASHPVTPSETISVAVGAGGTPVVIGTGGNGQLSSFDGIVALGGGGGGEYGANGNDGGSGGGGGRDGGQGGLGTPGQGYDGGSGDSGGGGGAGGAASGIDGGPGLPYSITGPTVYYGGGGGGSGAGSDGGLGGIGGGGDGRNPLSLPENGLPGAPNTGGGGGASGIGYLPGAGGSGVVIVRW